MRLTKLTVYFLLILLFGGFLLVANDIALAYSDRLCPGLVIADVPVGGLSVGEAGEKIAAALREKQSKPIATLHFEKDKWDVAWDAVAGRPEAATLLRQAYSVGRTGNLLQRLRIQFVAKHGGHIIPLGLSADGEKLRAIVVQAAESVDREAVSADITEDSTGLRISEDKTGRRTDIAATVLALSQAIAAGNPANISLNVKALPAAIRTQDLRGIDGMVSSFSTTYDVSDENRSHNIRVATASVAGVLVKAGEVFSFNDIVGLRTPERGYKTAPTLSSAGVLMDWGGGVCQVSSTLYNAALLADFAIVERSAHYQPPVYVPLGQDATVADGQIDLRIKNTRKHAVYIRSVAADGKLEVRVYGKRESDASTVHIEATQKIVHVPQTLMIQDATLPLGQEIVESPGYNGFTVTVQRIRLQGQKEISREMISTDEFDGADRIVRVGTYAVTRAVKK